MLKCPIFKNAQILTLPSLLFFKNSKFFTQSKPSVVSWNTIMLISLVNFCSIEKIKNSKIEKQT